MSGFSDRTAQAILNHIVGKTAVFGLPQAFVALFTAAGIDAGTGFTEVIGGGYARASTVGGDWNSASGSAPSVISNANPIVFPTASSAWTNIIAFGLYDAQAAGNLLAWDYFGNFPWRPTTVNAATPAQFTQPGHGYLAGDQVVWSTEYGGVAPSGGSLSGLMVVANPTADTFTTGVNTTGSGEGMIRKVLAQNVQSGIQPLFAAGSLNISAA
jgi:hypothetical protein